MRYSGTSNCQSHTDLDLTRRTKPNFAWETQSFQMHVASEIKFSAQREIDEGKRRKTVEYRENVIFFGRRLISKIKLHLELVTRRRK